MTNCPTAQAAVKSNSKNLSVQSIKRFAPAEATNELASKTKPITKPPMLTIVRLRETIAPASSREGKTANALGATAKLKKTAAPSQMPINKSLIFERNFIA